MVSADDAVLRPFLGPTVASAAPRDFQRFVGVGLGGGRGKNTAVARLEAHVDGSGCETLAVVEAKTRFGQRGTGRDSDSHAEARGAALFHDEVLIDYLRRWVDERTVVAMDVPLTVPACIRCDRPCPGAENCEVPVVQWMRRHSPQLLRRRTADSGKPFVTPYTQRATEILLAHQSLHPREALGQGTGPLAARAHFLRRALSPHLRLHENLIEVHPRATLIRLFGNARERATRHGDLAAVWEARKSVLREMTDALHFDTVWPELVARHVQVFHAVIAAFTAYGWSRESWPMPMGQETAPPGEDTPGKPDKPDKPDETFRRAVEDLDTLWVEDGWIVLPPTSQVQDSKGRK